MEIELILAFLGASVLLTLMPGPDNIFVLSESLTKGYRTGTAVSVGLSLGVLVHTTAAAMGLSILLLNSALAFQVIKYLGAAYLLYLAVKAFGEKPLTTQTKDNTKENYRFGKLIRKGFFMNGLNPKVSLFFIAFLPQFVSKSGINIVCQMFVLGILFMIQALLIFISISKLAGKLSSYLNNPKFWEITRWAKITTLTALSITLALSKK